MSVTVNPERIKKRWKSKWEAAIKALDRSEIEEAKDDWSLNAAANEDKWFRNTEDAYKEHRFAQGVLDEEAKRDWAKNTFEGLQEKARKGLSPEDEQEFVSKAIPYITLVKEMKVRFNKIAFPDPVTKAQEWVRLIVLLKKAKKKPEKLSEVRSEIMSKIAELESKYGVAVTAAAT